MGIHSVPRLAVIVVAAGSGTRLGANLPKAFVAIDEHTILWHSLRAVFAVREPAQVVVVVPPGYEGDAQTELETLAGARRELADIVTGGSTRQDSVAAGLAAVRHEVEVVLVHDAARALTPPAVFHRVIDAVDATGMGAIPVVPVVDTIKRVSGDEILGVIDRSQLAAAQTPQGFRRDVLDASYRRAAQEYTDDAALVAAAGHPVAAVPGDERSLKITTPSDLERVRALVTPASESPDAHLPTHLPRVGIGTDVHAFGGEGSLWLAGLEWPGEAALSGHSDGDAVAHAIVDALLSAAGLGDIGLHFGTARPEFAGAHAEVFLDHTRGLLSAAGWAIGNVAVQVQASRPRFAARREEAERVLSAALGGAPVSVSATTTDGLGFPGRGEGVAAFAVAVLVRL